MVCEFNAVVGLLKDNMGHIWSTESKIRIRKANDRSLEIWVDSPTIHPQKTFHCIYVCVWIYLYIYITRRMPLSLQLRIWKILHIVAPKSHLIPHAHTDAWTLANRSSNACVCGCVCVDDTCSSRLRLTMVGWEQYMDYGIFITNVNIEMIILIVLVAFNAS